MWTPLEVEKTKPFVGKMMDTVLNRYRTLELALTEARAVPIHNIVLTALKDLPIWAFDQSNELIELGVETCSKDINSWQKDDFTWKWSNPVENERIISRGFGHIPPEKYKNQKAVPNNKSVLWTAFDLFSCFYRL
jgi:hypothetical protein